MGSKKRDLEIIYKLQWKSRSSNDDDKTTVVGIYDTPATTLKWELFKKYLLKNSGTTGNDIKVSYFTADDVEVPIETETDFQIAMYTFRNEARKGAIINLLLDRVSGAKPKRLSFPVQEIKQCSCCSNDEPPAWFKKYMKQMKTEITQELTESVLNAVGFMKLQGSSLPVCPHVRKCKSESKKTRKAWLIGDGSNEKDLRKSLRFDHKLDHKLEKLERKTLKLKEKKVALTRSSDSDSGAPLLNKLIEVIISPNDETGGMDAALANQFENTIVPHLMGGEAYMQQWEVINSGKFPWTEETEIRYAWGSKPLSPVRKIVPCPKLNPGEKGPVCVLLEVPEMPGSYECHWYFYHKGKRFGCSLDCELIVDPSPIKRKSEGGVVSPRPNNSQPLFAYENELRRKDEEYKYIEQITNIIEGNIDVDKFLVKEKEELKCSSDSDNQSIISIADSNASNRSGPWSEFVMVSDTDADVKKEPQAESVAQKDDDNNNNNNVTVEEVKECPVKDVPLDLSQNIAVEEAAAVEEIKEKTGYAYVMLNGKKIAVPKKFLHNDYLQTAEDAPEPVQVPEKAQQDPVDLLQNEPLSRDALESIKSDLQTSFDASGRLFVFPQNCPGFEVVHPQIESMTASVNFEANPQTSSSYKPQDSTEHISGTKGSYSIPMGSSVKYNPYGPLDEECKSDFAQSTPPTSPTTPPTSQSNGVNFGQQFEQAEQPKAEQEKAHQHAVHMLPDNIVTSAVHVASSAINTARSVLNMIKPQKPEESGKFLNGHWVTTNPDSKRECDLRLLEEMGFTNRDYNATLLNRFDDDMEKVIFELLK